MSNKLHTPYRERILRYCGAHGILVPPDFDATKSSESLVLVDVTERPFKLVARSTHLRHEALEYMRMPSNVARTFRVLDFKRGCELIPTGDRFARGTSFDHRLPDERTHLVEP